MKAIVERALIARHKQNHFPSPIPNGTSSKGKDVENRDILITSNDQNLKALVGSNKRHTVIEEA
jgi:hypothetical protein